MTNRRGNRGQDPNPPDDASHLTEQDVERRLGGGAGLGAVEARAPEPTPPPGKPPRPPRRPRGGTVLWRDVFLVLVLLGFLGVGAQFVLQRPSAALIPPSPGASSVALASPTALVAPSPTATPELTAIPLPSDVIGSLLPELSPTPVPTATPVPTPTPTTSPGLTPRPTPKPTPKPTAAPSTAHLTVSVLVKNLQGGSDVAGDWTVKVTGASPSSPVFVGSTSGTTISLKANTPFSISTTAKTPGGYTQSLTGDCGGPLAGGVNANCTIVQDDKLAHVTVTIQNLPSGGPVDVIVSGDANLHASPASFGGDPSGTVVAMWSNRAFTVSATATDGGSVAYVSGLCSTSIGLNEGGSAHCTYSYTPPAAPIQGGWFVGPLLALIGRRRSVGRRARS
jgi:hypothetical protein